MIYSVGGSTDPGEGHVNIDPYAINATIQGTWAVAIDPVCWQNGNLGNFASHAINDEVNYKIYLAKGTYNLSVLFYRADNRGILTFSTEDGTLGTVDMYGVSAPNIRGTITGIVVPNSGIKTLSVKIASKNGASSNYYAFINNIILSLFKHFYIIYFRVYIGAAAYHIEVIIFKNILIIFKVKMLPPIV